MKPAGAKSGDLKTLGETIRQFDGPLGGFLAR
jgi:hypothetical protein